MAGKTRLQLIHGLVAGSEIKGGKHNVQFLLEVAPSEDSGEVLGSLCLTPRQPQQDRASSLLLLQGPPDPVSRSWSPDSLGHVWTSPTSTLLSTSNGDGNLLLPGMASLSLQARVVLTHVWVLQSWSRPGSAWPCRARPRPALEGSLRPACTPRPACSGPLLTSREQALE